MINDNQIDVRVLFSDSNNMAEYVRTNPEGYRTFLSIAAKCAHFTPSNQLLIQGYGMGKIPEYLDDLSNWINNGYAINEDAHLIHVMEKDKNAEAGYKDRILVDVSDTNAIYNKFEYDKGIVLEALMTSSPCRIEYNESLTAKALYVPNRQVIEVSRGYKNIEQIFENLSREMVHARLHFQMLENSNPGNIKLQYPRSRNSFLAYSVSYMMASKYDMAPEQIEVTSLPEEWNNLSFDSNQTNISKADAMARVFKEDVLRPLNDTFKSMDNILSNRINYMYNQAGSEL
ncbi:MAG: hypothetical protein IJ141_04520 [Lachnospiraceae bacterium]|nr:hypothetical protein [Lachnospiraceae bacterium]